MIDWFVPRSALTADQLRAVELSPHENRAVSGPPGSGKTLVLLHRADYLARRAGFGPMQFRVFTFGTVLADYMRTALELLGLPAAWVVTFDHWCMEIYRREIGGVLPWDERGPDFAAVRRAVRRLVQEAPRKYALYDFALVDEGQDLDREAYEILAVVARHVTVGLDYQQQIFEHGSPASEVYKILGVSKGSVALLKSQRCRPWVRSLAARLLAPAEREGFVDEAPAAPGEREQPLLYRAADVWDEVARLAEVVKTRTARNESVGILLGLNRHVQVYAQALTDAGLTVEARPDRAERRSSLPIIDFASDNPKVLAYPSAKGLSFDTVLLPRLSASSFPRASATRQRQLLFVALTRARRWVYLSAQRGRELPLLAELGMLASSPGLTVQEGVPPGGGIQLNLYAGPEHRHEAKPRQPAPPLPRADPLTDLF